MLTLDEIMLIALVRKVRQFVESEIDLLDFFSWLAQYLQNAP